MSAKHTPGPWSIEDPMGPEIISIVRGNDPQSWIDIAQIGTVGEGGDDRRYLEHMANAHLIAAAPELLEALETLLGDYEAMLGDGVCMNPPQQAVIARAAIAKAKGEPA